MDAKHPLVRIALGFGLAALPGPALYLAAMLLAMGGWVGFGVLSALACGAATLAAAAYAGYELRGPGAIGYVAGALPGLVAADDLRAALMPILYPDLVFNGEDYLGIGMLAVYGIALGTLISLITIPPRRLRGKDPPPGGSRW